MARFQVVYENTTGRMWLVVDKVTDKIVYRTDNGEQAAAEVAECKNWDEENEIFDQFG